MNYKISFDRPSSKYNEALPVGNGRIGAMVLGSVKEKKILLNEETVWYGGPRDRNNCDALVNMDKIRQLMKDGKIFEAERLSVLALTGTPETQRHFSTLGMVVMDFFRHAGDVENYNHSLDFKTATTTTSYSMDGVDYRVDVFASAVDSVVIARITSSKTVLDFYAGIERGERVNNFSYGTHMDFTKKYEDKGIVMGGSCGGVDGLLFCGVLLGQCDGDMELIGDKLVFKNSSEVVLYISGGTNFENENIEDTFVSTVEKAMEKGYKNCYSDHLKEWNEIYNNVSISLKSAENIKNSPPMNRIFDAFKSNDFTLINDSYKLGNRQALDDYLVLLLFHFGRYILASSSRKCSLPAALQGLWCRDLLSIWDGKYTTNINLQMAYWSADSANLSSCFEPYLNFAKRIRQNGIETAKKMYGCRGFVLHNNTDIWADTAVQDSGTHCSYWFVGGVWIAADMWEHYRYTRDLDFLVESWPIMRDAALFTVDYMEEIDGELVMGVSSSPENFYKDKNGDVVSFCKMPAMDSELISLLLMDCIEAIEILRSNKLSIEEIPEGLLEEFEETLLKIAKVKIGQDGCILEWGIEAEEVELRHRHQSHIIGAYPYNNISEKTPELLEAVKKTIEHRLNNGGGNNGWSRVWIAGALARLGNGNLGRDMVNSMVQYSCNPNLFSCCNIGSTPKLMEDGMPMQIDGNMGTVQAVIELLLQSHNDQLLLLPALPDSWKDGSFEGLVARGNVVINAWWENGKLTKAEVMPRKSGNITVKSGKGYILKEFSIEDKNGCFTISAEENKVYTISRK